MRNINLLRFGMVTIWAIVALAGIGAERDAAATPSPGSYKLGPGDEIVVRIRDVEDTSDRPVRVDPNGYIDVPLVGRVGVAGKSIDEVKGYLSDRLKRFIVDPAVSVNIVQYYSQPVSVLGAVANPGVQQLQGPKRLVEVIAMAGGPRTDAGSRIRIMRPQASGPLDLPGARSDVSGQFSVASVELEKVLSGQSPSENIYVHPNDVVTVSKADLVYVMGEVKKSGGFPVRNQEQISLIKALSLAEGLERTASPKHARIIRTVEGKPVREIPVDAAKILDGKAPDVLLQAEDVLYIPNNLSRNVAARAAEAALQIGTGVVIWRR